MASEVLRIGIESVNRDLKSLGLKLRGQAEYGPHSLWVRGVAKRAIPYYGAYVLSQNEILKNKRDRLVYVGMSDTFGRIHFVPEEIEKLLRIADKYNVGLTYLLRENKGELTINREGKEVSEPEIPTLGLFRQLLGFTSIEQIPYSWNK